MRRRVRLVSLVALAAMAVAWMPVAPVVLAQGLRAAPAGPRESISWDWNPMLATSDDATTPFEGVGIWWTLWGNTTQADVQGIVKQVKSVGMNAIYVRVADSVDGFYGQQILDLLLPLAHKNKIFVIGWYWSDLTDPAQAVQVATYTTSGGQKVDAITPDIESEGYAPSVRNWMRTHGLNPDRDQVPARILAMRPNGAPSDVLDTYFDAVRNGTGGLGTDYPIAATSWPTPYNHSDYSFASMSNWCQVFTPMAYWRATQIYSGAKGVKQYIDVVTKQYKDTNINPQNRPVASIGQAYDAGGPLPGNPPPAEITAFLQQNRADGGIGASFYDYNHITAAEWNAVRTFITGHRQNGKKKPPPLMSVAVCNAGCTVYRKVGKNCTLETGFSVTAGWSNGYAGIRKVTGCNNLLAVYWVTLAAGYDVRAYAADTSGWTWNVSTGHTLNTVNLRSAPNCNASVLGQVSGDFTMPNPATTISMTHSTGPTCHSDNQWHEWWNVTANGQTGWIWGALAAGNLAKGEHPASLKGPAQG